MTDHQPQSPSPGEGCLFALGALLLLPGLCSVLGTFELFQTLSSGGGDVTGTILSAAGYIFGALGVYLVIKVMRRRPIKRWQVLLTAAAVLAGLAALLFLVLSVDPR
jgi:hypothetical protein